MEIDFVRVYQESTLSLQGIQENVVARVYPLPFDDHLNIQLNNIPNQHTLLRLYAIDGKLIDTYDAEINNNSLVLNKLNNLSEGLYFLNFEINKQTHRLAVVKN